MGLGEHVQNFETIFRWAATLPIVMIWLSIVYRVGPSRSDAKWRWVTWGSGLSTTRIVPCPSERQGHIGVLEA